MPNYTVTLKLDIEADTLDEVGDLFGEWLHANRRFSVTAVDDATGTAHEADVEM